MEPSIASGFADVLAVEAGGGVPAAVVADGDGASVVVGWTVVVGGAALVAGGGDALGVGVAVVTGAALVAPAAAVVAVPFGVGDLAVAVALTPCP